MPPVSPHRGNVGQTWTMQHAASSDIRLANKQTLSPALALPISTVTVVDWPFPRDELRLVSAGARVNAPPCAGVNKICDIGLPELFVMVNV